MVEIAMGGDAPDPRMHAWEYAERMSAPLLRVTEGVNPLKLLVPTVVVSGGLALTLHVIEGYGTAEGRSVAAAVMLLVPALLVTLVLMVLLGRLYWHTRLRPEEARPYQLALLAFAAAAAICAEAFAATTMWLWRHGAADVAGQASPSLWAAERQYIWHLVDAIPLLSIPSTLGWAEPVVFTDKVSGVLLLVFQIAVLVPLVHLALSVYHVLERKQTTKREERGRPRFAESRAIDAWSVAAWLAFLTVLGGAALALVSSPSSSLNRWFRGHVPDSLTVADATVPLSWSHHTFQVLVAVGLVLALLVAIGVAVDFELTRNRTLPGVAGAIASFLLMIVLVTEVAAATTITLLDTGAVETTKEVPGGGELEAALTFYVWHTADAVPGLAIPSTLRWNLPHDFTDYWSGVLLLLYKTALVVIVLVPVGRVIRRYVHAVSSSRPVRGGLDEVGEFGDALAETLDAFDHYEDTVLKAARTGSGQAHAAAHRADGQLQLVDQLVDKLWPIFGDGAVRNAAIAAVTALEHRLDAIARYERTFVQGFLPPRPRALTLPALSSLSLGRETEESLLDELAAARQEAEAAVSTFVSCARRALRHAVPRARVAIA